MLNNQVLDTVNEEGSPVFNFRCRFLSAENLHDVTHKGKTKKDCCNNEHYPFVPLSYNSFLCIFKGVSNHVSVIHLFSPQ